MASVQQGWNAAADASEPRVRRIGVIDVIECLRLGWIDFREKPSHFIFLGLLYPVAGIVLFVWSTGANLLPLLFPLASGFSLLGPVASLGLYEVSRQREMGQTPSWQLAFGVFRSPAMVSIAMAAAGLLVLFIAWLTVAQFIYEWHFGPHEPVSIPDFLVAVLTTSAGWSMMAIGNLAGLAFALAALAISIVTFPLLLERDVGAVQAIKTSVRATVANPVPVGIWGLVVAAFLVVGSLPMFVGLTVVLPVLGHASWHLYRMLVEPPPPRQRS